MLRLLKGEYVKIIQRSWSSAPTISSSVQLIGTCYILAHGYLILYYLLFKGEYVTIIKRWICHDYLQFMNNR